MAFGEIYRITGTDIAGNTLKVEIHKDGYSSLVTVFDNALIGEGFSLTIRGMDGRVAYTPVRPIVGTFWMNDTGHVHDAITGAGHLEYQAHFYVGSTLIAKTYIQPKLDYQLPGVGNGVTEPLGVLKYPIAIDVVCGLSLLKYFPYQQSNGDPWTGFASVREVMQQCVEPLGYEMAMSLFSDWYLPGMIDSEDPLEERDVYQDDIVTEDGYPPTCDIVLQDLCAAHALEFMQVNGTWIGKQVHLYTETTNSFHRYTAAGSHSAPLGELMVAIRDRTEIENRIAIGDNTHPILPALDRVTVTFDHKQTPRLIRNPTIETLQRGFDRETGGAALYDHAERRRANEGRTRGVYTGQTGGPRGVSEPSETTGAPDDFWRLDDDSNPTIGVGLGPDGENVLILDRTDAGSPAGSPPIHFADADKYYHNVAGVFNLGRSVAGGTGRGIVFRASSFVLVDITATSILVRYPVYIEYKLMPSGGGASFVRWLQNDGSWSASQKALRFAERNGVEGSFANTWETWEIVSDDMPAGTWTIQVRLYGAIDPSSGNDMEKHYWTNIFSDVVVDDVIAPSAEVIKLVRDTSFDLLGADFEIRFGTTPVRDMPGSITIGGAIADDVLIGAAYDAEPLTGVSQQQALAETLLSMQATPLKCRRVGYTSKIDFIQAHETFFVSDGVDVVAAHRVGDWTYNFASRTQGGTLIEVNQTSPAATLTRSVESSR